jgi:hypothetical protein
MVSLDDLPVRSQTRAEAREWVRRWERLAYADQDADAFSAGMSNTPADPVTPQAWRELERDGHKVWIRLRAELGGDYELGWAYEAQQVEGAPGAEPESPG